jgi:hypothetical protein
VWAEGNWLGKVQKLLLQGSVWRVALKRVESEMGEPKWSNFLSLKVGLLSFYHNTTWHRRPEDLDLKNARLLEV